MRGVGRCAFELLHHNGVLQGLRQVSDDVFAADALFSTLTRHLDGLDLLTVEAVAHSKLARRESWHLEGREFRRGITVFKP